jgi:hypothetical protein
MCNGNHSFFYSNNAIPVTFHNIAGRHGIHMNSPVPRLGLDLVQGRAGPEQLEDKNKLARSVQRSRKTLIDSISTSTRAGVEPEPLATRTVHHQVELTVSLYWSGVTRSGRGTSANSRKLQGSVVGPLEVPRVRNPLPI